jgi:ABC-type uncharacterized transport system permease subunit
MVKLTLAVFFLVAEATSGVPLAQLFILALGKNLLLLNKQSRRLRKK